MWDSEYGFYDDNLLPLVRGGVGLHCCFIRLDTGLDM